MAGRSYFQKGIVLAGGAGTRLYPITKAVSKQLLPVYDKPLIYYSLSTLMLAGIRDILIITTPHDAPAFQRLLGDGSQFGINLHYAEQSRPDGLPHAYIIGRDFVGEDNVALVLGDNIFYGQGFQDMLADVVARARGGTVFTYPVKDPERYGVMELDDHGRPVSLQEKPSHPKSTLAITGLYFFDNRVIDIASGLQPSARGETEILDVVRAYLQLDELYVEEFGRGFAWLDTGTYESLLSAGSFVETIEQRQGLKIACLEEIAFRNGFISADDVLRTADSLQNGYGEYLRSVVIPTRSQLLEGDAARLLGA